MKTLMIFLPLFLMIASVSIIKAQAVTTIAGPNININDAIVVDDEGNIYGSDFSTSNNGAVYKIATDGTVSLFSDGYSACNGLDIDSEGNLYVCDFTSAAANHQIYKLNSVGEKNPYGPPISGASGILFDPLSDTLYVSQYNGNNNAIVKLAPDESIVPYCNHSNLNGPVGMAFDDNHEFYTANFSSGEIYRITYGGDSVSFIADIPNVSYWGIGFLTYASGYLYATGIGTHFIYQVSLSGEVVEYAGTGIAGLKDGAVDTAQFNRPNGITTNAAQDIIYISDYATKSVRMITDISTMVESKVNQSKKRDFELYQNFPNPLMQTTTISYELFKDAEIKLSLISTTGQTLSTFVSSYQQKGKYSINLDASQWPSGLYLIRLQCDGISVIKKMNIR